MSLKKKKITDQFLSFLHHWKEFLFGGRRGGILRRKNSTIHRCVLHVNLVVLHNIKACVRGMCVIVAKVCRFPRYAGDKRERIWPIIMISAKIVLYYWVVTWYLFVALSIFWIIDNMLWFKRCNKFFYLFKWSHQKVLTFNLRINLRFLKLVLFFSYSNE